MIIDSHCHLNEPKLYALRKQIIKDAQAVGVEKFIVVGYDYDSCFLAVEIAHEFDCCYAAIGIMPTDIDSALGKDEDKLFELLNDPKVVALGEIGLDYHWEKTPEQKARQKEWFIKEIEIANKYHKPIIIHARESLQDTLDILKAHPPLCGGVMHCYSGSPEMVSEFTKLGLYIGVDGPVTFLNGRSIKEVAQVIPEDRILLETDSPYLTPHPHRGEMNTPVFLPLVASEVALLRGKTYEEISEITYNNTVRLFKL